MAEAEAKNLKRPQDGADRRTVGANERQGQGDEFVHAFRNVGEAQRFQNGNSVCAESVMISTIP